MLKEHKHVPILVSPKYEKIEGHKVYKDLSEIKEKVDTLTVYVNPKISSQLESKIIALKPKRVIFNPGSENHELAKKLEKNEITTEEACTLVLLTTNQF